MHVVLGDCLLAGVVKNTCFPPVFSGLLTSLLEVVCSQFHLIIFHELVLNVKIILLGRFAGLVRSDSPDRESIITPWARRLLVFPLLPDC